LKVVEVSLALRRKAPQKKPAVPVVAIGASAGGLPAIKSVFSKIKKWNGGTCIFVQHLEDKSAALAQNVLSKICKQRIIPVTDKLKIKPGAFYLVPPHTIVRIENDEFRVSNARFLDQKLSVIDHLFSEVGKAYRHRSVGIILSGNASDGAAGIKDLNECDGLTIAQNPKTAEFPIMPNAAIATAAVDHVLDPADIGAQIQRYAKFLSGMNQLDDLYALKEQINAAIPSICEILLQKSRHDFKHYKSSTLTRRIQRRMQVLHIDRVEEYIQILNENNEEIETLFSELLINVTSFFRDREAFEALRTEVLEVLLKNNPENQKIRIWVPGCSTGEEPYTIAMLLLEAIESHGKKVEAQIIATDIDEKALNLARKGSYSASIAETVPAHLLAKYFTKRGGRYHVNKELRELCLFSIHNLINDPPFSQLDLISCRNLIIYMGPHLQKKLFPVFHYALRNNGYLFLGTSESLTTHKELFKSLNSKYRIAQRKPSPLKLQDTHIGTSVNTYLAKLNLSSKNPDVDLSAIGQRIALDEMPIKYVVINDEGQILSVSSGISKYVEIAEGPFQNNLIKLVKPSLRAALRTLFSQAKKEKRKAYSEQCVLKTENFAEKVGVIVQPMPQLGEDSALYWVAFQYLGQLNLSKLQNDSVVSNQADSELIDQLEHELSIVRGELDKSVQDLEASNEELKSSNEELLSMNEELQSANEELETSKEEVQEVNTALMRSNSDLENLLAGTQIATLFLDNEMKIRRFTPSVQKLYRVKESDIGREISDFKSLALNNPNYPTAADFNSKDGFEDEIKMPDGTIYLRRVFRYQGPEEVSEGFVATFIEITDQYRLREKITESQKRYEVLFNYSPLPKWTVDIDTLRFIDVNEAAIRHYGFTREEFLSMTLKDIYYTDQYKLLAEKFRDQFASGRHLMFGPVQHKKKDGSLVDVKVSSTDLILDGIKVRVAAIIDITEQSKLEVRLTEAKEAAEAANKAKTRFLANMSHEIRTPLAAIIGFTDLVRNEKLAPAESSEYLDRVSRNAGHLGKLIDELLDLSKIEADKLDLHQTTVNVDSLLDDVFSTVKLKVEHKALDLRLTWLSEKPKFIIADRMRLWQILTNLLSNAVKFTNKGYVNVSFKIHNDTLTIRVKDSGIGMNPEQKEKIFEPFVQADPMVTQKYGGTGLGLALSKKLAQRMGGDIHLVASAVNEGSEFEFHLPIQITDKAAATATHDDENAKKVSLQGKKILVVDDSQDNRILVRLFLKDIGAEISEAIDGADAINHLRSNKFDIILMDIQMPIMDGHESFKKIKQMGIPTPVIALTAHALKEERDRCLNNGFADYLTKPIQRQNLILAMQKQVKS
jgi:two-component system CheB/CheR fusion protein